MSTWPPNWIMGHIVVSAEGKQRVDASCACKHETWHECCVSCTLCNVYCHPGVYLAPAVLKDDTYTMPIGALGHTGSSNDADNTCCILDYIYTAYFPDYILNLDVCSNFRRMGMPPGFTTITPPPSKSTKGPRAPVPAANGTTGSDASTGRRDPPAEETLYEGVAMVVSGPMYISNWATNNNWEVTGVASTLKRA